METGEIRACPMDSPSLPSEGPAGPGEKAAPSRPSSWWNWEKHHLDLAEGGLGWGDWAAAGSVPLGRDSAWLWGGGEPSTCSEVTSLARGPQASPS